jgi:transposase
LKTKYQEESAVQHTTIAIDLAKSVFEVGISDRPGHVCEQHRLSRNQLPVFFANRPPTTVLMEACSSSHHWARQFQRFGHDVKLLPPSYVRPYVHRSKTDRADVKGMLEAWRNSDIRPVPVKTISQQQITALHRMRSTWVGTRTARINAVRGVLREFGIVIPVGASRVAPAVTDLIEIADNDLPMVVRDLLHELLSEIRQLEGYVAQAERQLQALGKETPIVERLRSIPGIGLLTSTALVAFIGEVSRFPSGRHLACYLGLTPREHSSGQRRYLGRISKSGDVYLRMLLIHGARSVLLAARSKAEPDRLHGWALKVQESRGHNKATVAVANKLARMIWAVWRNEKPYQPGPRTTV